METKTLAERTQDYQTKFSDIKTPHDQFLIGKAYYEGATEQHQITHKDTIEKAKCAFCFAECGRCADETCPNTDSCVCECEEYEKFVKILEGDGDKENA